MKYIDRYGAGLSFKHNLKRVDGPSQTAWFEIANEEGRVSIEERKFDFLHVCPPQTAPDFIRGSPLADENSWIDVDQNTLNHKRYANIWSLGDVTKPSRLAWLLKEKLLPPIYWQAMLKGREWMVSKETESAPKKPS